MAAITVTSLAIPDVKLISTQRFGDNRGFFSETFSARGFHEAGIKLTFVQDNHSRSEAVGTLRGLHFQSPPFAQDKLVRVTRGRILDVAVDIRRASPTFGRHVTAEISADAWNQVLIPAGFAHGFVTLEPDTEVLYKVTNDYAPSHDHGILWSDPALGIAWPFEASTLTLSDKDKRHPRLAEATTLFP
jgi:dTDP-4-dehydrorhamnose 3,5-epimerase